MDSDEFLNQTADAVLRSLKAKGYRLVNVASKVGSIKEKLREYLENFPVLSKDRKREITDSFFVLAMANGCDFRAQDVANYFHVNGHFKQDKAISLWLGLFFNHSTYCEGLWQMYLDCQEVNNDLVPIPEIISKIFHDPKNAGSQLMDYVDYRDRQLGAINAQLAKSGMKTLEQGDILKLIAWIVAAQSKNNDQEQIAAHLDTAIIKVHKDLRMGYNTLLWQILRDIYQAIDAVKDL